MRDGEERGGQKKASDDTAEKRTEQVLKKTAVDELFADGHSDNDEKKDQALNGALRKDPERQLRSYTAGSVRHMASHAKREQLVGKDCASEAERDGKGEGRFGNRETEIGWAQSVGFSAPKNQGRQQPLHGDRGTVETQAIALRSLGATQQLLNATSSQQRHDQSQKHQYQCVVRVHWRYQSTFEPWRQVEVACGVDTVRCEAVSFLVPRA